MKYEQLRHKVQNWKKHPDCATIDRSPLINSGFPGTFNLSFTEGHWLKEYGKFIEFDHDYVFSTIQSCIRPNDILETSTPNSWRYLGVFELGDLTGIINLKNKPEYLDLQRQQARSLVSFFESIGTSKHRIYPSYNLGGQVRNLTNGKYTFDFNVPEDFISKQAFLEAGIPEENLIGDKTRNTFLSLHVHRPTPWGYRNEVSVNLGSKENPKLLDVATMEYLMWKPIFNGDEKSSKNIIGLQECKDGVSISAVGLERACMIANNLTKIQDVDYIKPFYQALGKSEIIAESIRVLHRIYSDINSYGCKPSRHQKAKISKILKNIPGDLDRSKLKDLLIIHSETQPWHLNLEEGIEPTIERIEKRREN